VSGFLDEIMQAPGEADSPENPGNCRKPRIMLLAESYVRSRARVCVTKYRQIHTT
jgi:hypothetical protein